MTRLKTDSQLSAIARFLGRLSLAGLNVLVIALVAWHLLRLYPGDRWLPVRLGSYFAPWFFMALVPGLGLAMLARRRWLAGAVLLLMLIFVMRYGPPLISFPSPVSAETNDNQLRVMTFNVQFNNRDAQTLANFIRAEAPDIIALQELMPGLSTTLLPELAADYPYHLIDNSWEFPMVLVSRYPLTTQPKPVAARRAQHASVETPYGPVTVWNVHPSPAFKQNGWESQRRTLTAVADGVKSNSGPVIVLGDFNSTSQAENFELIATHLSDTHRSVGRGFGFTFPQAEILRKLPWYWRPLGLIFPILRIDHVLVSHQFVSIETHVVPDTFGSDHRPVVATLRLVE